MGSFQSEAQVAQQKPWVESVSQPGLNVEVIAFSSVLSEHKLKSSSSLQLQLLPQYSQKP